jgi:hypothetical protein
MEMLHLKGSSTILAFRPWRRPGWGRESEEPISTALIAGKAAAPLAALGGAAIPTALDHCATRLGADVKRQLIGCGGVEARIALPAIAMSFDRPATTLAFIQSSDTMIG